MSSDLLLALPEARAQHRALLLPSGEILVVGGVTDGGQVLASTVLVTSAGVEAGPTLSLPRVGHSLTLLPTGEVLIAGGADDLDGAPTATTEVFDPASRALSPGPDLQVARSGHAAALVDGAVVVAGGWAGTAGSRSLLDSIELVRVDVGVSELAGQRLSEVQAGGTAVALDPSASPGQVAFLGALGANGPVAAEVFDARQGAITTLSSSPLRAGAAIASAQGEVLIVGGEDAGGLAARAEHFDGQAFTSLSTTALPRRDAVAERTDGGLVVVAGGVTDVGVTDAVELLGAGSGGALPPLDTARRAHTLTAAGDWAFAIGGYDSMDRPLRSIEAIDLLSTPQTGTATAPAPKLGLVELTPRELVVLLRASTPGCSSGFKRRISTTNGRATPRGPGKRRATAAGGPCDTPIALDGPALLVGLLALGNTPSTHSAIKSSKDLQAPVEAFLTSVGAANPTDAALCAIKTLSRGVTKVSKSLRRPLARMAKGLDAAAQAAPLDPATHVAIDALLKEVAAGQIGADDAAAKVRGLVPALGKAGSHGDKRAIQVIRLFDRLSSAPAASPVATSPGAAPVSPPAP